MTVSAFINAIAGSLGYSLQQGNALTQGFSTPISYIPGRTIHGGLDIRGRLGTPIPALRDGTVVLSRTNGGWGENVIVRTDDGYFHWYAHLNIRQVHPGQRVTTGQVVGTLGTTGYSTGPHLHFEVRDTIGRLHNPFVLYPDPMPEPPFVPTKAQQEAYDLMRNLGVFSDKTPRNHPVTTEDVAIYMKRAYDLGLLCSCQH